MNMSMHMNTTMKHRLASACQRWLPGRLPSCLRRWMAGWLDGWPALSSSSLPSEEYEYEYAFELDLICYDML